jgi:3-hydroxyethyl bacteriochlorophyllide a dehydrogenase
MKSFAVVFDEPRQLSLRELSLAPPGAGDVVVRIDYSSISAGTERLLWEGRMPVFPGLGYPLVPGYESVGVVTATGPTATIPVGTTVFVPGANCYGEVRGLFGGASRTVVAPAARVIPVDAALRERATLLALGATAYHAIAQGARLPELIVGHGVFGRLVARITRALGGAPVVWERNAVRSAGADGYAVLRSEDDARRDYHCILDASGDAAVLDTLMMRLAKGGEVVLAGFYSTPISFAFPPAFMKEARLRIAAEWSPGDLAQVLDLVTRGELSLDGLITDISPADRAADAYRAAFDDPACLKMVLDWSALS